MPFTPIQPQPEPPEAAAKPAAVPTFADAVPHIAGWTDITEKRRDDLISALRSAARLLGLPPAAVPCDPAWLNERLYRRPAAAFGITDGRFRNIVSLLRTVLRRLGLHSPDRRRHSDLPPPWQAILAAVAHPGRRALLARFARFCAAAGIDPSQAGDADLERFSEQAKATALSAATADLARSLAQAWNAGVAAGLPGWPPQRLKAPARRQPYTLPFSAYPESFQADVARYRRDLAGEEGRFLIAASARRRLRPATVGVRLFAVRQAAGLLVQSGVAPERIRSLRDLVQPLDNVASVLDALAERQSARSGEQNPQGGQLATVAETLRQIALHHVKLDANSVARITDWTRLARGRRGEGLSRKNRERLRALVQIRSRALLLHLPAELMRRARAIGPGEPDAARLALLATALEILLVCPLRRRSLLALRLDEHLQRLDPRGRHITHLVLQDDDMKNREPFEWPLPSEAAKLIESFIRDFRPTLAAPDNFWLFPGPDGALGANRLAQSLVTVIEQEVGVPVHLHLLRHFAAWLYLKSNPGSYEDVRRALGHRSLETTIGYYVAFETAAAAERFDATVLQERRATRTVAAARWGKAPRPAGASRRVA